MSSRLGSHHVLLGRDVGSAFIISEEALEPLRQVSCVDIVLVVEIDGIRSQAVGVS